MTTEVDRLIKRLENISLGAQDKYTQGHAERVAAYSKRLARRLGLSKKDTHDIQVSGVLHDIGKIGFSFSNSI